MRATDTDMSDILLNETLYKTYEIFQFMIFHRNLLIVQNHCVLGSMQ